MCVRVTLLCLVAGFVLPGPSYGQFPRACMTVDGITSKECCPELISPDGRNLGTCGEVANRGSCQDLVIPDIPHSSEYPFHNVDDRERWPNKFFNRTCACEGNFWGYNCGECRYGWAGDDCDRRAVPVTRKNILNCTAQERQHFMDVLDQAKRTVHPDYVICKNHWSGLLGPNGNESQVVNVTYYNLFVWLHYYAVRDTYLGPNQSWEEIDFAHEGPAYNTWHRMHLMWLERELQRMLGDDTFALHYWNWAVGGNQCDICTDDLLGGRHPLNPTALSPGSPFSRWQAVCMSLDDYNRRVALCNGTDEGPIFRNPGGNVDRPSVTRLPNPEDVGRCLALPQYDRPGWNSSAPDSFRNALEGYDSPDGDYDSSIRSLHNLAHLFLNGTGAITHASANDPIFVLLHSYSDAIFEAWLHLQNDSVLSYPQEGAPIGHNLNSTIVPFFPAVRNQDVFRFAEDIGFAYDVLPKRILKPSPVLSGGKLAGVLVGTIAVAAVLLSGLAAAVCRRSARTRRGRDGRGVYQPLSPGDTEGFSGGTFT